MVPAHLAGDLRGLLRRASDDGDAVAGALSSAGRGRADPVARAGDDDGPGGLGAGGGWVTVHVTHNALGGTVCQQRRIV